MTKRNWLARSYILDWICAHIRTSSKHLFPAYSSAYHQTSRGIRPPYLQLYGGGEHARVTLRSSWWSIPCKDTLKYWCAPPPPPIITIEDERLERARQRRPKLQNRSGSLTFNHQQHLWWWSGSLLISWSRTSAVWDGCTWWTVNIEPISDPLMFFFVFYPHVELVLITLSILNTAQPAPACRRSISNIAWPDQGCTVFSIITHITFINNVSNSGFFRLDKTKLVSRSVPNSPHKSRFHILSICISYVGMLVSILSYCFTYVRTYVRDLFLEFPMCNIFLLLFFFPPQSWWSQSCDQALHCGNE